MPLSPPPTLDAPQASDFGLKAWNLDYGACTNNTLPTAGALNLQRLTLRKSDTISSLWVAVAIAGATLTNVGFGLWDMSGNLLTSSVNANGATATAFQSAGAKQVTFTTPQNIAAGSFYGGMWFTGSTIPALQRGSGAGGTQINVGLASGTWRWVTANTGLTTTAPNPFTTPAAGTIAYWMGAS